MDLSEIKGDLTHLVLSGRKDEAIQLLQDRFQVDRAQAEKLLGLAVKESVNPGMLFKTIGARLGGKGLIFKFVAFGLGFMGIPMAMMFAGLLIFDQIRASNSIPVKGVVVELETFSYSDPSARPIIEYTFDTETFTAKGTTYSSPPAFEVGEEVPLLVAGSEPGNALIDTFSERWLAIVVLGVVSTFFLGVMFFFIRLSKRTPGTKGVGKSSIRLFDGLK